MSNYSRTVHTKIREQFGTILDFSDHFGIPRKSVYSVMEGKANHQTIRRVAEGLGIPASDLVRMIDDDLEKAS